MINEKDRIFLLKLKDQGYSQADATDMLYKVKMRTATATPTTTAPTSTLTKPISAMPTVKPTGSIMEGSGAGYQPQITAGIDPAKSAQLQKLQQEATSKGITLTPENWKRIEKQATSSLGEITLREGEGPSALEKAGKAVVGAKEAIGEYGYNIAKATLGGEGRVKKWEKAKSLLDEGKISEGDYKKYLAKEIIATPLSIVSDVGEVGGAIVAPVTEKVVEGYGKAVNAYHGDGTFEAMVGSIGDSYEEFKQKHSATEMQELEFNQAMDVIQGLVDVATMATGIKAGKTAVNQLDEVAKAVTAKADDAIRGLGTFTTETALPALKTAGQKIGTTAMELPSNIKAGVKGLGSAISATPEAIAKATPDFLKNAGKQVAGVFGAGDIGKANKANKALMESIKYADRAEIDKADITSLLQATGTEKDIASKMFAQAAARVVDAQAKSPWQVADQDFSKYFKKYMEKVGDVQTRLTAGKEAVKGVRVDPAPIKKTMDDVFSRLNIQKNMAQTPKGLREVIDFANSDVSTMPKAAQDIIRKLDNYVTSGVVDARRLESLKEAVDEIPGILQNAGISGTKVGTAMRELKTSMNSVIKQANEGLGVAKTESAKLIQTGKILEEMGVMKQTASGPVISTKRLLSAVEKNDPKALQALDELVLRGKEFGIEGAEEMALYAKYAKMAEKAMKAVPEAQPTLLEMGIGKSQWETVKRLPLIKDVFEGKTPTREKVKYLQDILEKLDADGLNKIPANAEEALEKMPKQTLKKLANLAITGGVLYAGQEAIF